MVFRKAMLDEQIDIAVINASYSPETLAHLIKYDTNHGRYELDVTLEKNCLFVNGKRSC
jgi:glyceraldehyde 3-phosphate dehydrogenase